MLCKHYLHQFQSLIQYVNKPMPTLFSVHSKSNFALTTSPSHYNRFIHNKNAKYLNINRKKQCRHGVNSMFVWLSAKLTAITSLPPAVPHPIRWSVVKTLPVYIKSDEAILRSCPLCLNLVLNGIEWDEKTQFIAFASFQVRVSAGLPTLIIAVCRSNLRAN